MEREGTFGLEHEECAGVELLADGVAAGLHLLRLLLVPARSSHGV
jgi:hypothetical protein